MIKPALRPDAPAAGMFRAAHRIAGIGVSEILSITAIAEQRKRDGRPVVVLGAGEPDFDTPDFIKDAAARAMRDGQTKYTTLDGSPAIKAAICEKFATDNGLIFRSDEISVSSGSKQVINNAMMATLDPGDEVILAAPYWVSYADIIRLCGGTPVIAPCSENNGFRLTPDCLEELITPRTRWIIFNSPCNPSGAVYSAQDYRALLDVIVQHPQVWVLADDIYEHITFGGTTFATPAQCAPEMRDRILTVNGVSKAFAMTGWRLGYGAGPTPLIKAMAAVQSQSTSCPSSISQAAAIVALRGPLDIVKERCDSFRARRDVVVSGLNSAPGLRCPVPQGAFYVFANCAGVLGKRTRDGAVLKTDSDFASYLLLSWDVAVVPGSAFGLGPYFRISYATAVQELDEALRRISAACQALQ
ncbi:pyridoxal phosphate-dependent aminotransferase [Bradyrhizobium sp. LHD-71]|uniref:pyridoxal phosphate-dependent aminotransferase n=1 Tax=Bradyrhizobium sp. LHD-71 TaxID=3072141 RepID=UPI00280E14F4|nr:pyridoxal phosphate-dependent aminotransferase [Bradyrhizobium sp. LHD-71]MDQ8732336.1 pyridoxal phosphate-dependent aminotransferase [Bradyrhizobium sp. LHD-71]